jgi:hypothetical protein
LNAVLLIFSAAGLGLMFKQFKVSPFFAILCMLQQGVIFTFLNAWSEPLFITLSIWGFYFFLKGLTTDRIRILIIASFLFGLATLTRYNGFIFLPLMLILILAHKPKLNKSLYKSIAIASVYLIPVMVWFIRNLMLFGTLLKRDSVITSHEIPEGFFHRGFLTLSSWIYPGWFNKELIAGYGIALALLICLVWIIYKRFIRSSNGLSPVIAWYLSIVLQLILVVFTVCFADKVTEADQRILSFSNLGFIVLIIFLLVSPNNEIHWKFLPHMLAWLFFIITMKSEMEQTYYTLNDHKINGSEFTSTDLPVKKPVIKAIHEIKDSLPILSNNLEDIYLTYLTKKPVGYINDVYKYSAGQQFYIAFFHENHKLPETGLTYLHVDSMIPGYLYKLEMNH